MRPALSVFDMTWRDAFSPTRLEKVVAGVLLLGAAATSSSTTAASAVAVVDVATFDASISALRVLISALRALISSKLPSAVVADMVQQYRRFKQEEVQQQCVQNWSLFMESFPL
jgi:hypothetical protein